MPTVLVFNLVKYYAASELIDANSLRLNDLSTRTKSSRKLFTAFSSMITWNALSAPSSSAWVNAELISLKSFDFLSTRL